MDQRIIDAAIRQWRTRLRACIKAKGGHFEHTWVGSVFWLTYQHWLLDICAKFYHCVCLFTSYTIKTKGSRNYESPCRTWYSNIAVVWQKYAVCLDAIWDILFFICYLLWWFYVVDFAGYSLVHVNCLWYCVIYCCFKILLPFSSEPWWLSGGKGGILSELLHAALCTTVVHNGIHTNMRIS